MTDNLGNVISTVDLDSWGGETWRSSNQTLQPHRYTTYERDGNGGDEAMMRRYQSYWNRFSQPDPYDGSYDFADPQSFNRYAYTQNDPVNFVDPTGLDDDEFLNTPDNPEIVISNIRGAPWAGGGGAGGGGDMIALFNFKGNLGGGGGGDPQNPGRVIYTNRQEGQGANTLYLVDVRLANGNVARYKDLSGVSVRVGQNVGTGDIIGSVRPAGDPRNYVGLHLTLVNGANYAIQEQCESGTTISGRLLH